MLYFTMPQRRLQVRRLPLHKKEAVRVAGWNAAGLADAVPAWRTQSNAPAGPVRMLAQMQMQGSLAREGAVPAKMARSRIQYAGRNGLSCPDRQRRPF